mgnify:CR=1 FL=1
MAARTPARPHSQRRRNKAALRYASVALVRAALTGPSRFRRHLPPALLDRARAGADLVFFQLRCLIDGLAFGGQELALPAVDVFLSAAAAAFLPAMRRTFSSGERAASNSSSTPLSCTSNSSPICRRRICRRGDREARTIRFLTFIAAVSERQK